MNLERYYNKEGVVLCKHDEDERCCHVCEDEAMMEE